MSDADKTPVDGKTTLEMVLEKLGEVGRDAKLAVTEAREAKGHSQNAYNLLLEQNEEHKALSQRVRVLELTRFWLPLAATVLAAIALLRAW